ncbi:GDSL-type esterase/lipase family protein [Pedobacter sp. MW01-1-1]|uniref:GDSL-type esterase/lipase family protein n=1 Tax=Pedobacter sp. MW01-1-1 TaxID=3383027 RepID=UPI003FF06D23
MRLAAIVYPPLLLLLLSLSSLAQNLPTNNNKLRTSCPEAAQYYAKDSINIVTFGASTVEGVKGVGFQDYLKASFINCYTGKVIDITNHGIGGQTTYQGLLRLENAISGRTGFIVIDMGINDAVAINAGKQTVANTEANMRVIIQASLNQKLVPILCTLQNADDRNNANLVKVNAYIKEINAIYRRLAKEYKIYLADVNFAMRRDFSLYQDVFHPNAKGYQLISYVIFDTISKAIFDKFLMFVVNQNYPNPATTVTYLDIVLPETDKINVQVYDIMGRLTYTALNDYLNTGKHTLEINTSSFVPGVYFFKISSNTGLYNATKKFIVAK